MHSKIASLFLIVFMFLIVGGCSDDVSGNPDDDDHNGIVAVKSCIPPCWQESIQEVRPPTRYFYAMAYDENRKVTVLFGGNDENYHFLGDTWEFDGSWHKIRTQVHPSKRWKSAICYSPQEKCIILFGGGATSFLNDTWKYDGQNWTKIVTTHKPERRANATMIYDDHIGKILLFGGENASQTIPYPHTTWLFDGLDWSELDTTSSGLYGREGCKMVYDSGKQRTVLYGGTAGVSYYNTTWEFDGQTWVQVHPSHNPGGIAYYALAYDQSTGRTVLFGGGPFCGFTDRTWEYDGNDWTQIFPDVRPPTLSTHSMVYDIKRKRMVMFGGISGHGSMYNGTWFYWGEKPALATPSIRPGLLIALLCILPLLLMISYSGLFNKSHRSPKSRPPL